MSMTAMRIEVAGDIAVSGILQVPEKAAACCVMAHGAGAGMTHPFMAAVADGFAERRIATLRYQFPSMERGSKRPDKPVLAQATVRAAVAEAARLIPSLPLFAGGKSFGGRMTSQAQAQAARPTVQGLIFFGFPLHPAKKPSDTRAQHLFRIGIPMLFLQGTGDALADMALLDAAIEKLGQRTTVHGGEKVGHWSGGVMLLRVACSTPQKDRTLRGTRAAACRKTRHSVSGSRAGGPPDRAVACQSAVVWDRSYEFCISAAGPGPGSTWIQRHSGGLASFG